ncbi:protein-L-isoaspartate(D-aspartate) O-methyltransferase [Sulfuricaulis sp.]|uniref:protein-L-isoaspartate(D-aspartate) O-methyltransferase n=1 Tax=Sulfuricaulis sp. TaxID=2003553 RepID=UPI003559454C
MRMDVHGIGMTSQRTRDRLIQRLREEGIRDERVLEAMRNVPRHLFVDEALATRAYEDTALPIGQGQTISQPYIVALMTQALLAGGRLKKVLEVGTGSGYQTAILAQLVDTVYSVERIEPLMKLARKRLREIGCRNVQIKLSDGSWGWKDHAPYDGIIVTAAPAEVPLALIEQLAPGGRLIIPVGGPAMQELLLVQHTDKGLSQERLELVNFVPLVRDSI